MGHARAEVFRRRYIHKTIKIDPQDAYLGTVNRSDLVKNIGPMNISRDPRTPVQLGAGDLEKHHDYLALSAL